MRKVSRGTGFRGVLAYAKDRDGQRQGLVIGGNLSGQSTKTLVAEFTAARKLRPDIEKPVWHQALRLPDGEKISNERWEEIGDDYMQRMGFTDLHQRVYVLHDDPDGQHIHIIANRIALDGTVFLGQNENLKSTAIVRALEKENGLRITQERGDDQPATPRKPTPKESRIAEEAGVIPVRQRLQRLVDLALTEAPEANRFAGWLEGKGVGVRANLASTGKLNGFAFVLDGVNFKGSDLGAAYKLKGLTDRGLNYDYVRDGAALRASAQVADQVAPAKPLPTQDSSYQGWKTKRIEENQQAYRAILERRAQSIKEIREQGGADRKQIRGTHTERDQESRSAKTLAISNQRIAQVLAEAQARNLAVQEIERHRQTKPSIGYRDYLADMAQAGSLKALDQLRWIPNTRDAAPVLGNKVDTAPARGVRPVTTLPTTDWLAKQGITSTVDRRTAAVSYFRGGKLMLIDQRYAVTSKTEDPNTLSLQLDFAVKKLGYENLRLTGTDTFKARIIELASSDKRFAGLSFEDRALQARLEAARQDAERRKQPEVGKQIEKPTQAAPERNQPPAKQRESAQPSSPRLQQRQPERQPKPQAKPPREKGPQR